MKKYILPIIILIAFIVLIAYFYFNKFNFNDEIDHNANRLSTEVENSTGLNNDISKEPVVVEEEISNFSTKIIDDDDNRDTNIRITCNEINGTIIKDGEEFSFNKVAESSTSSEILSKISGFSILLILAINFFLSSKIFIMN